LKIEKDNNKSSLSKNDGTLKAGSWVVFGKLLSRFIDFALLLILGRILTPDDFGLVALAMAPVFIIEAVLSIPIAQAILSHPKVNRATYDTAFTLSIIRGLILGTVLITLSFPMAQYFEDERLTSLICVLAIAPILRGAISPRIADYMRRMDFRPEFLMDLIGKITAFIIAAFIAYKTKSYWAIAATTVVAPIIMNVLSYIIAPYKPHFSMKDWPHFSDILGWNTVSQILQATSWQADRILLGRSISSTDLGRYTMAHEFSRFPHQIIARPITGPIMASFSNSENEAVLKQKLLSYTRNLFTVIAPIAVGISLLSEPFIMLTLGVSWITAALYLKWLALAYVLAIPIIPLAPLALSKNKTIYIALRSFIEFAIKLPALIIGINLYGVWGAIGAGALAHFITILVSFKIIKELCSATIREQVSGFFPCLLSLSILFFGVSWAAPKNWSTFSPSQLFLWMTALVIFGCLLYITPLVTIWFMKGKPDGLETQIIAILKKAPTRKR